MVRKNPAAQYWRRRYFFLVGFCTFSAFLGSEFVFRTYRPDLVCFFLFFVFCFLFFVLCSLFFVLGSLFFVLYSLFFVLGSSLFFVLCSLFFVPCSFLFSFLLFVFHVRLLMNVGDPVVTFISSQRYYYDHNLFQISFNHFYSIYFSFLSNRRSNSLPSTLNGTKTNWERWNKRRKTKNKMECLMINHPF